MFPFTRAAWKRLKQAWRVYRLERQRLRMRRMYAEIAKGGAELDAIVLPEDQSVKE